MSAEVDTERLVADLRRIANDLERQVVFVTIAAGNDLERDAEILKDAAEHIERVSHNEQR